MSGTHTTAKLIPAQPLRGEDIAAPGARDRLAWPAAALLIIVVSGGLWYGAALALGRLLS